MGSLVAGISFTGLQPDLPAGRQLYKTKTPSGRYTVTGRYAAKKRALAYLCQLMMPTTEIARPNYRHRYANLQSRAAYLPHWRKCSHLAQVFHPYISAHVGVT